MKNFHEAMCIGLATGSGTTALIERWVYNFWLCIGISLVVGMSFGIHHYKSQRA